jgi:exosome complex component RRP42
LNLPLAFFTPDLLIRYFVPYLHLTLTSTSTGSVLPTLIIAARAAFADLRIPKTKRIGWEAGSKPGFEEEGESDLSGIKAAVRAGRTKAGKGKGRTGGDEWDLDMEGSGDGTIPLEGKEELPVLVTLHLVSRSTRGRYLSGR